ncbi:hypothetical protein [Azospirillum sp. B4]|uniref:hypothetical protein n=1 Tax=Azospirillum sp. B4 TaxID=95605 RepID=UPI0020789499|nr:hypothetical protein [Azospirillum sp. B4]
MLEFPSWVLTPLYVVGGVLGVFILAFATGAIVYIRNDAVGIVEKLWAVGGSVEEGFLALAGEAGFRPETLRGGFHFFMPLQYRVHRANLVTVPQGSLAYLFARGGQALPNSQALARCPPVWGPMAWGWRTPAPSCSRAASGAPSAASCVRVSTPSTRRSSSSSRRPPPMPSPWATPATPGPWRPCGN